MSYLTDYATRLNAYGSTVQDSTTSFGRSDFEEYLNNAPNSYNVLVNGINNVQVTIQDSSIIDKNDETKTVLSRYNEKINLGDIITWNDNDWLVILEDVKVLDLYNKVQILQCNNMLKFYDGSNVLHEVPCIINNKAQGLDKNLLINSSNDRFICLIQYNDDSKLIKLSPNQFRFILNGVNLKVISIDNISHVINNVGYLVLILESDLVQELDDTNNNIADNTDKSNQNIRTDKTLW